MSIPKIIHYCWFGNEMPPDISARIESWRRVLPEYEFVLWSEKNFDVNYCDFSKEAYSQRKYAFVSDVARLVALSQHGGVYLDTDVDVLKSFDGLLQENGFAGFESSGRVGTCVIGAQKGNGVINSFLDEYRSRRFLKKNGNLELTPNTVSFTRLLVDKGLQARDEIQKVEDFKVFPEEWFCPYNPWKDQTSITENTVSKHLFHDSWNQNINEELKYIRGLEASIEKWIRNIDDNVPVILYGMGVVCKIVIEELRKYERVSVRGIMTTKKDNDWTEFYGTPILGTVDQYKSDRNEAVLICTIPKYHDEIKQVLDANGYEKIYVL